jgi:hypothetical protein
MTAANKYAKAIVAAVVAGGSTFYSALDVHVSVGHALVLALIAVIAVGAVGWGVPNNIDEEVETRAKKLLAEWTAANPTAASTDAPTQVFAAVKA